MIALLVCSSKGPRDGCSLGLWCPQVSDGGEHAHGLTAHDTLIARGVLWQEGGEGEGGEGEGGEGEGGEGEGGEGEGGEGLGVQCANKKHCIVHIGMSKVSP